MERKAQTSHFVFAAQFDIIVAFIAIGICACQDVGVCGLFMLTNHNSHVTLDTFPVKVAQRASEHVIGLRKIMHDYFV